MVRARVVTPWVGDGSSMANRFRPKITEDFSVETSCDVTSQDRPQITPSPNEMTVEIKCTEAVLDAIEADSTYEVLWSEDIP